jgi:hypothetical protein
MRDVFNRKKREIIIAILFCVIALFPDIKSYADEQKKEILVARDVALNPPLWCGDNAFVVSSERFGLKWIDFLNKKEVKISSSAYVGIVDCTSDGEWIVYVDTKSSRWDKGSYERGVVDFWRYSLKTGKRQKFAVASGGGKRSPDGKKILFDYPKPRTYVEQPEPNWEMVWTGQGISTEQGFAAYWLADSDRRVITTISDDKVYIEKYSKDEPARLLNPNIDLGDINNLKIDAHDKIYILSRVKQKMNKKTMYGKARLLKCSINGKNFECEDVLKRDKDIVRFDITPDGKKILFQESVEAVTPHIEPTEGLRMRSPVPYTWRENAYIWLFEEGTSEVKCITPNATGNSVFSVSPDGKRLVFTRSRVIEKTKTHDVVTNDLYLINLTE